MLVPFFAISFRFKPDEDTIVIQYKFGNTAICNFVISSLQFYISN